MDLIYLLSSYWDDRGLPRCLRVLHAFFLLDKVWKSEKTLFEMPNLPIAKEKTQIVEKMALTLISPAQRCEMVSWFMSARSKSVPYEFLVRKDWHLEIVTGYLKPTKQSENLLHKHATFHSCLLPFVDAKQNKNVSKITGGCVPKKCPHNNSKSRDDGGEWQYAKIWITLRLTPSSSVRHIDEKPKTLSTTYIFNQAKLSKLPGEKTLFFSFISS